MAENSTDAQEPQGSGRHRGQAASAEEPTSAPHGRHRREAEDR